MVFYRFWKLNPDAFDFVSTFNQSLFDTDPSVMQSSLIAYYDLIQVIVLLPLKRSHYFVNSNKIQWDSIGLLVFQMTFSF